jgi:diketogulonate reductase-like aldo/keto reductase
MGKRRPDSTFTRRDLLRFAAAVGAALPLGVLGAPPAEAIRMRAIPSSGEGIPAMGLGTSRTFEVGAGAAERAEPREVMERFAAAGGRVVDSSPMYGSAETVVGDLAADLGVTDGLFFATKVWTDGREDGIRQMERSMARLRTGQIDLMQVHNLVDTETHLRTLRDWKEQGRVRYIGITHYHEGAHDDLTRWLKNERLDFVQLNYSIAEREAEDDLLPLAAERGVAVLVNRPFARGNLFRAVRGKPLPEWAGEFDCHSWAQYFLKYVLGHPAVTCPIPATSKPKHLVDNMQAAFGALPDAGQRRRMRDHLETL